jgi:hypothetical protein
MPKPKNKTKSKSKKNKVNKGITNDLIESLKSLNNSKYFAGIMMIVLNLGSKYITLELSKSQEAYLKYTIGRQVLIFSIIWMGTRDIVISLVLTALFVIMTSYLFNENSKYCILPKSMRELKDEIDTNHDGKISQKEIDDALEILKKAKQKKKLKKGVKHDDADDTDHNLFRENYI